MGSTVRPAAAVPSVPVWASPPSFQRRHLACLAAAGSNQDRQDNPQRTTRFVLIATSRVGPQFNRSVGIKTWEDHRSAQSCRRIVIIPTSHPILAAAGHFVSFGSLRMAVRKKNVRPVVMAVGRQL